MAVSALWNLRARQPGFAYPMLLYVFVIFSLGTIGNGANMKFFELIWIENRDFEGGPNAFFADEQSFVMSNVLSLGAYIVATWMQDGFLVGRRASSYSVSD
jgi:hypothetical protein